MSKDLNKAGAFSLAAVAVAVWAGVLLIAFFANRGDDVGKLGQFVGNLGSGPLAGAGIVDSLVGLLIAGAIAAAWFGIGNLIVSRLVNFESAGERSYLLNVVLSFAVGAAIWSFVWFLLGLAGLYSRPVAVVALVLGVLPAIVGLLKFKNAAKANRESQPSEVFDKFVLLLAAVPVLLSLIAALAPPTAKDTLLYHFSVPKAFIAQGSSAFIEGNIASYLALGTEMHVVWAMLLGGPVGERAGEAAAGAVVWLFFPLLLAALFGFARETGISRRWSLIAVLMVATVPTAYHVAASAYIDLALALYVLLAAVALTRWWRSLESRWLILMAIFLGAALASKLTTLFVIAAFALVVVMRARSEADGAGKAAGFGLAALVLAGVFASPWYLRTWAETGSPIFPFYMSIWPGEAAGWDVERSNLFQAMNAQYGGYVKTPLDYLAAPWNISITAQPELATHFDGVLGVAFLLGLPFLAWALWKFEMPAEAKIGSAVAAVMFLFWLFSSQQLRYLLPIVPLLAIGIAAAFERLGESVDGLKPIGQVSFAAASIAGLLTGTAWFLQKAPLRVALGGESKAEYLTRNLDYYPYYRWLNAESDAGHRVWLINMRRDTYNLERPYFSDYLFEDWTLRRIVWESRSAPELKAKAAAMNVQFVLSRHDFLFDYDRSPIIDDTKPRAENEAKLKMARELLLDPARTVKADARFSLVKVF
ncbi:MAG: glycosyltransferase family 39 protein [Acidobacteria bacterium]|nr:glycosyltransferase family 39 protein [Acidobacteriota bacterium]